MAGQAKAARLVEPGPGRVGWVAVRLTERDRAILDSIHRLRMATSAQIERLHFHTTPASNRERIRRRVLARLTTWGVLGAIERPIGGPHAGSGQTVYHVGPIGHLLTDPDQHQPPPGPPSRVLLPHALAITSLYVDLIEQSRAGAFRVATFDTEPACWRRIDRRTFLKPDAYLELGTRGFKDRWFLEVDLSTEHLPVITKKLDTYLMYRHQHRDIRMPSVLITVPDKARYRAISTLTTSYGDGLVHVITHTEAAGYLTLLLRE